MDKYSHTIQERPRSFWRNRLTAIDRREVDGDLWEVQASPNVLEVTLDTTRGLYGRIERWEIAWGAIQKVEALLQDNFSYDTVWIRVSAGEDESVAFPEDASGFKDIAEQFTDKLPGCAPLSVWFRRTVRPPLVPKCVSIFERNAHAV